MKKLLCITFCLVCFGLSSAFGKSNNEVKKINVASLKGPTSIGLVKMMDDADSIYDFKIYVSPSEIVPLIVSGKVDIANIPANLSSVLYAKTEGKISVININTLGVIYMVGMDGSIKSFNDVKGKTIFITGKGATPEYSLNYLLQKNGLKPEDFRIEYKSEATEIVAALKANPDAVGVLPQPFVTVAVSQIEGLKILMDFTEEWKKCGGEGSLITGVTVVNNEFLKNNKKLVNKYMKDASSSIEYVNSHAKEISSSVEKYGIIKASIAEKAIPFCNLKYIDGKEMKDQLSKYLNTLFVQDPKSVGGNLPDDKFYYQK